MLMNKKLSALLNKFKAWRKRREQAALVKLIADSCTDEGAGHVKAEPTHDYGVDNRWFSDVKMKIGSHCVEKGVYIRRDGSPLIYPMKIKHNDGSVDIIKIFTAEENGKLEAENANSREATATERAYAAYRQHGGWMSQMEFIEALNRPKCESKHGFGDED